MADGSDGKLPIDVEFGFELMVPPKPENSIYTAVGEFRGPLRSIRVKN
jgi:hypothetical protein